MSSENKFMIKNGKAMVKDGKLLMTKVFTIFLTDNPVGAYGGTGDSIKDTQIPTISREFYQYKIGKNGIPTDSQSTWKIVSRSNCCEVFWESLEICFDIDGSGRLLYADMIGHLPWLDKHFPGWRDNYKPVSGIDINSNGKPRP